MIKITGIEVVDFGRHKKIKHNCEGYVVGLCGPNGLGKSTILQALQFALTGTIDHPDPLRAFIRRSSGDKPPKGASVVVDFEVDGKKGKITRRITKTKASRKLEWEDGSKPMTSEKQVSEAMFDILGVDKKAINSTVFIRQGEMASMFGKDTDRRDFYTRLLMLGHMEKVADIVDVHRKHISASVQDLTAVRDAAQQSYDDARVLFEDCDETLSGMIPMTDTLDYMRGVLKKFSDLAGAESHQESSDKELQGLGRDAQWLATTKDSIVTKQSEMDSLSKRKTEYTEAVAERSKRKDRLESLEDLADKFVKLEAAEKACSDLQDIGESPAGEVDKIKDRIRDVATVDQLNKNIPNLNDKLLKDKPEVEAINAEIKSAEATADEFRAAYAMKNSDLSLRSRLKSEVESLGDHSHSSGECPVCGSNNPSLDHLNKSVISIREELDVLESKGKQAANVARELSEKAAPMIQSLRNLEADIDSSNKLRAELTAKLLAVDTAALPEQLKAAEEKLTEWSVKRHEMDRLRQELSVARAAIPQGVAKPTDNELGEARALMEAAVQSLQGKKWDENDSELEKSLREEIRELREETARLSEAIAKLDAANERLEEAKASLQDELDNLDPQMSKEFIKDGDQVLTQQVVQDKIDELQVKQSEYDSALGKRKAAHESLTKADDRLGEMDLRIAEQKHRLLLVDDLTELRDAFKPNGVSLEYLNYKFGQIAQLASDYLAESQANFMVMASDEQPLAFDFIRTDRPDEVWMPQNRMSGGQKVRLAVATLRAIHALVMPNVGLLVLDEPTTHLDHEAKKSMAEMLQRIGEEGVLQMIVCDHSTVLTDAFSDVIEIKD